MPHLGISIFTQSKSADIYVTELISFALIFGQIGFFVKNKNAIAVVNFPFKFPGLIRFKIRHGQIYDVIGIISINIYQYRLILIETLPYLSKFFSIYLFLSLEIGNPRLGKMEEEGPLFFRDGIVYREWGYIFTRLEKFHLAELYFDKAIKQTQSNDLRTYLGLVKAQLAYARFKRALKTEEKCVELG